MPKTLYYAGIGNREAPQDFDLAVGDLNDLQNLVNGMEESNV